MKDLILRETFPCPQRIVRQRQDQATQLRHRVEEDLETSQRINGHLLASLVGCEIELQLLDTRKVLTVQLTKLDVTPSLTMNASGIKSFKMMILKLFSAEYNALTTVQYALNPSRPETKSGSLCGC